MKRSMLAKKHRITRKDFPHKTERSVLTRGESVNIYEYAPLWEQKQSTYTAVIGKKYGPATKRNLLRRRIYKAIAEKTDELSTGGPKRIVVYPQKNKKNITWAEVVSDIGRYTQQKAKK